MNYIKEIDGFERWLEINYLPALSQALWYKLMYYCNRMGWPEWFQVDNRRLMMSLQIAREASLVEYRDRLVNAGLIVFQRGRKGSPNKYHMVSCFDYNPEYTFNLKAQTVCESVVQSVTKTEAQTVTKSVAIDKQKQKTIKEGAKAPKKKEYAVYYPNNERINHAFLDFLEMRRQIKKPMTDRAVALAMDKLQSMAQSISGGIDEDVAVKILEQSTMNCWQGLFPVKEERSMAVRPVKQTGFHNFDERGTDYDTLVKAINEGGTPWNQT